SAQLHRVIEAMRRAFRDRAQYAADPAFFPVPLDLLTSKDHARELAASIESERATPSRSLVPPPGAEPAGAPPPLLDDDVVESADTTHFAVIDAAGNMVSNTYTLNNFYGSQVIVKGTGVLMNDIMG